MDEGIHAGRIRRLKQESIALVYDHVHPRTAPQIQSAHSSDYIWTWGEQTGHLRRPKLHFEGFKGDKKYDISAVPKVILVVMDIL